MPVDSAQNARVKEKACLPLLSDELVQDRVSLKVSAQHVQRLAYAALAHKGSSTIDPLWLHPEAIGLIGCRKGNVDKAQGLFGTSSVRPGNAGNAYAVG